jgi:hypothetical protein
VDQVIDKIRVVDAIDADLDRLPAMRVLMLLMDRRADAFVLRLGMVNLIVMLPVSIIARR